MLAEPRNILWADMCMCLGVCVDMYADMCLGVCADMCIDLRVGICLDVLRH